VGCVPLLRRLASSTDEETAAALADAFGRLGHDGAEHDLVRYIDHAASSVRHRAARGLGICGTVEAVPRLRAAVSRRPQDRELARLVDEAIAAIRSRLQGAEAGQLTLAEGELDRGALSLAGEGAAGDLSTVEDRA
jgi:HEAT repeat protein